MKEEDPFYSRLYRTGTRSTPPGEAYYREAGGQFQNSWRRWLPPDKEARILDLGCGCGEFLVWLKSLGYTRISGVDSCAEEIELGRKAGLSDLSHGDACAYLEGRENQLDLISALNLFEHLDRDLLLRTLQGARRALKPGGRLLALTPNGLSPFSGATRYWDFTHQRSFTPASWSQLAAVCGFSSVRFEECGPVPHSIPSTVRWVLWKAIRLCLIFYSLVEVGGARGPCSIYTADMKVIFTK